jgi:hypothetical protein
MSQLLAIDPEFEARCPPLTDEEYAQSMGRRPRIS